MRGLKVAAVLLMLAAVPSLEARYRAYGYCEKGGQVVVTSGMNSTTKVQQSYPSCTVTVYLTGTTTLATLYADNSGTPKANPFTADASGYWFWYADNGRYDVRLSGGGIATPFTLGDIAISDPSTVTVNTVPGGGTGATSLTGVVVGSGTDPLTGVAASSQGQYLRRKYNVTGTSYEFVSPLSQFASDYNWASPQNTTITVPGTYTFTVAPCPLGFAVGGYAAITGGIGVPEGGVIGPGSTCTSGAGSGTVEVTLANAHSGTYTLGSATAGIAETIGIFNAVTIPEGTHKVYAPVNISGKDGLSIRGMGASSIIDIAHASNDLFVYDTETDDITLADFAVTSSVTRTGGWAIRGTAAYDQQGLLRWSQIRNLTIRGQVNGFWLNKYAGVLVDGVVMEDFVASTSGIGIKAGQTAATDVNQGSELHIVNTQIYGNAPDGMTPALGYAYWIEDCDAVYLGPNSGAGLTTQGNIRYVAGGHGLTNHFMNGFVSDATDGIQGAGVLITGTGTVTDMMIDNSWFASAGGSVTLNADGLKVATAIIGRLDIRSSRFFANQGSGIYISGATNTGGGPMNISGNTFTSNGLGNQAGHKDDIYLDFPFDQNAPFVDGNVHTGSPNGFSIRTAANTNLLRLGVNHWQTGSSFGVVPLSGIEYTAFTTPLGGSAMSAGDTISVTTSVPGAVVGMTVITTPGIYPGDALIWQSYVSAADTVVTKLYAAQAGTPLATSYYLRVKK
jgi:hypothetical protein